MTLREDTVPLDAPADDIATDVPQPRIQAERSFVRELLETVLLIAAIYAFVNLATARFVVDGNSMLPNFETDQFIIVSRLSYILGDPQRGDVVVFHYPMEPERDFIKRLIGLPGETVTIQDGHVYVNGKLIDEPYIENFCRGKSCDGEWVVGPDEYFVLGDNRSASKDSQDFGTVSRRYIVGRALVRYWPPSAWGILTRPSYNPNGAPLPTVTPTHTPTVTPTATMIPPAHGILPPEYPPATPTPRPADWTGSYY
ncbi:MAG: signal peptidase I [Chloroflexi bacterium]|nr:signal peptidase I [Chloroflexota bacterium]